MNRQPFRPFVSLWRIVWMWQPFRAFVSWWLIICMVFSLMPLGCHSVRLRHGSGRAGQPHLPEFTAEQLLECGELAQEDIESKWSAVDARVELDENGRVLSTTTKGEPNPEVGMCIRYALRNMRVSKDVIDNAGFRSISSSSPNAGTILNREYIAEPVTVTVVVIVFVDVIIEGALVALGITVTATVAKEAAKAAQANAAPARKPHQPVREKWEKNGGTVRDNPDGSRTYTRSDGVAVTYGKDGFPDFTPYRHPTVKDVQIEFTGKYEKDFALADKAAGITEEMRQREKYTWHHHQDGKTMQLIKQNVHKDFFHTGGMSGAR
jgi:hypothetical protein